MECQKCCQSLFHRCQPYVAMISLQFGYVGMNIITKVSLNRGMSHYVLVVYRHAFAALFTAPFALILERKARPKLTFSVCMQVFLLGLLGPVIDQNSYYAGLKFTSLTFACAMSSMLPAMTFVVALLCRMEKIDLKKVKCVAKVVGTMVTVAGTMLMTLYKGPIVEIVWTGRDLHRTMTPVAFESADKDRLKGSVLLLIATLAWASLFILQAVTLKQYPAQLSLTSLICFMGTLQAIAVALIMEHKPSAWSIGWDMNLLAAAYAGVVTSSIAYYVQGLVIQIRGPVFASAFSPVTMILAAIMACFIFAEKMYLGGVLGAILIVAGMYAVLWGKYKDYKENKEQEAMALPLGMKDKEIIGLEGVEVEKAKGNGMIPSSYGEVFVVANGQLQRFPMKAKEEQEA